MTDAEICRTIAEKVMGWEQFKTVTGSPCWEERIGEIGTCKFKYLIKDWNPLHDGGQALEIVEKLDLSINSDNNRLRLVEHPIFGHATVNSDLKRAIVLCAVRCGGGEG